MSELSARVVLKTPAALGETPVWSAAEERLYWIDCPASALHRFDPKSGQDEVLAMEGLEGYLGSFALAADGGLMLASGKALMKVKPGTRRAVVVASADAERPENDPNDGKVDPQGRFWFGTMHRDAAQPTGSLFRYDGRSVERMDSGFACSNGLAWSPNGKTMYFVDMMPGDILAYDFDGGSGRLSNRRVHLHFDGSEGLPDGICADAQGGLWVAHWDGGCLTRYDAEGKRTHRVALPAPRVTCPIFGGHELRTLYVTTSGRDMMDQAPLSGSLFAIDPPVPGLPVPAFVG
jgi:sugar lactone lactonase YvrE